MTDTSEAAPTAAPHRGILHSLRTGLSLGILGLILMLGMVVVAVPALAGATPFTVLTGSMEPHLPPGTLIVVKPVDTDEITMGDVITYQLESGKPAVVTHRVSAVAVGDDNERSFTTIGDNNTEPDAKAVQEVQVVGKLWYSVPLLGYVNNAVGQHRPWLVPIVVTALFSYAGVLVISAAASGLAKRRAQRQASTALRQHGG